MATLNRLAISLVVVGAACGKQARDGDTTQPPPNPPDRCAVAGASKLAAWPIPQGCAVKDAREPTWIRTDADVAAHLTCGVDAQALPLLAVERTLSPATIGIDAYDDGKTITWVSRQRKPCPGERPPMPVPASFVFVATGVTGERADAESTCTVEIKCP